MNHNVATTLDATKPHFVHGQPGISGQDHGYVYSTNLMDLGAPAEIWVSAKSPRGTELSLEALELYACEVAEAFIDADVDDLYGFVHTSDILIWTPGDQLHRAKLLFSTAAVSENFERLGAMNAQRGGADRIVVLQWVAKAI